MDLFALLSYRPTLWESQGRNVRHHTHSQDVGDADGPVLSTCCYLAVSCPIERVHDPCLGTGSPTVSLPIKIPIYTVPRPFLTPCPQYNLIKTITLLRPLSQASRLWQTDIQKAPTHQRTLGAPWCHWVCFSLRPISSDISRNSLSVFSGHKLPQRNDTPGPGGVVPWL